MGNELLQIQWSAKYNAAVLQLRVSYMQRYEKGEVTLKYAGKKGAKKLIDVWQKRVQTLQGLHQCRP